MRKDLKYDDAILFFEKYALSTCLAWIRRSRHLVLKIICDIVSGRFWNMIGNQANSSLNMPVHFRALLTDMVVDQQRRFFELKVDVWMTASMAFKLRYYSSLYW